MNPSLAQKVILVTGASSGTGRSTCRELARQGAFVILLARNEHGIRETMDTMPAEKCLPLVTDLRDISTLHAHLERARNWQGSIDGCAYCAGIGGLARLRHVNPDFMADCMLVNCFAFVEIGRCLTRLKKKDQSLRIVAISSLASLGYNKHLVAYAASKAALEAAAKTMAVELASRNTTVNVIRPAIVDTPMNFKMMDVVGDLDKRLKENGYQPLGLIPPEEVAQMVAYLMSEAARHITGAIFPINAGAPC